MSKVLLVYEDYADLMNVEATLKRVGFDVLGVSSEYSLADQMLGFNPEVVVGSGRGGKVTTLGVGKRLKEMTRWQGKSILIFPANAKPAPQDLLKIRVDMILEAPVPVMRLVQVIARLSGQDEGAIMDRLNKMSLDTQGKNNQTGGGVSRTTPEEEAIFVKGNSEEADAAEHVEEDSERRRVEFRFGERMNAADSEKSGFSLTSEEAFPDVDLSALERELTGGGTPEPEKIETFVEEEPLSPSGAEGNPQEELAKAEAGLKAKMARYAEMTKDVKVAPKSTITRVEARRRQKALVADWDTENLNKLDELRRDFTKALFKK
ncbi:hypothetical protein [Bdellovibrio sp. HCB2-146]|uniref:hypothetical protein n=1 Tax=Bdellovibrio sp. HCB2-146 TaxID=3394362 RepID=UPI0039BC3A36